MTTATYNSMGFSNLHLRFVAKGNAGTDQTCTQTNCIKDEWPVAYVVLT